MSMWRISTTKKVEGFLTGNPSFGTKKKMEELCEMMKKKDHQDYEEVQRRDLETESGANKDVEEQGQECEIKIEEILTLMQEMNRWQKDNDEIKARKGEAHNVVHEVSHPSEPENMLQDYAEAEEELSRKKN